MTLIVFSFVSFFTVIYHRKLNTVLCFTVGFCYLSILTMKVKVLVAQSCLILWDPRTIVQQASLSIKFYRQKYWSGLPFPSPGDLPKPEIKCGSLVTIVVLNSQSQIINIPAIPEFGSEFCSVFQLCFFCLLLSLVKIFFDSRHDVLTN